MLKTIIVLLLLFCCLVPIASAQDDASPIMTVLDFGAAVFEPSLWRISGGEERTDLSYVIWRYRTQEGVILKVDYLVFGSPLSETRVADYFDAARYEDIFLNYAPLDDAEYCEQDGLILAEFTSSRYEVKYVLRYWGFQYSENVVMGMSATVPETHVDLLDEYAARLFPALPTCDAQERDK